MVENYNKINQDKLEMIANLSINGVMNLIDNIVKKYYLAYVDNDVAKYNSTLNFINDVVYMFEDDVDLLEQYVNYSMLKNANFIVATLFERDMKLNPFVEVDVASTGAFKDLSQSIRDSLKVKIDKVDKVNIKNLHGLCASDESVSAEIVELVDALYYSFNKKDGDADE